jgi:HAD superfamily hydrolase (TIGR01509 family)
MVQAVLFDMDGVLADSEPHWKRHWQEEVFPEVLEGQPTLEDVTGRNFRESLTFLDDEYGLPGGSKRFESEVEAFADEMYREKVTVTEGMPALFSLLRDRDLDIAVVSSSPRQWISLVVDRSDLNDPDVIVSAEDIEAPGKPSPAVYEFATERLGVEPAECVVVEDSKHGVKAASRAGATVIRYQCDHEADPIPAADHVAEDIAELRTQLLDLVDKG